jgi:hypothetical protein
MSLPEAQAAGRGLLSAPLPLIDEAFPAKKNSLLWQQRERLPGLRASPPPHFCPRSQPL